MPVRVIGAAQFLSLATHPALGIQIVIAAAQFAHVQFELPGIVRASGTTVLPELSDDLTSLFC